MIFTDWGTSCVPHVNIHRDNGQVIPACMFCVLSSWVFNNPVCLYFFAGCVVKECGNFTPTLMISLGSKAQELIWMLKPFRQFRLFSKDSQAEFA